MLYNVLITNSTRTACYSSTLLMSHQHISTFCPVIIYYLAVRLKETKSNILFPFLQFIYHFFLQFCPTLHYPSRLSLLVIHHLGLCVAYQHHLDWWTEKLGGWKVRQSVTQAGRRKKGCKCLFWMLMSFEAVKLLNWKWRPLWNQAAHSYTVHPHWSHAPTPPASHSTTLCVFLFSI